MLCARSRILMPERVHIAYEVRIVRDQLFVKWLLSYAIKRHHKFRADSTVLLLTFLINCHQRSGLHLAKYLFPTFTLELHVKLRTDSLSPLLISLGSLSDALCFLGPRGCEVFCSQFCSQPDGLNSPQWTRYEYMESQNL